MMALKLGEFRINFPFIYFMLLSEIICSLTKPILHQKVLKPDISEVSNFIFDFAAKVFKSDES